MSRINVIQSFYISQYAFKMHVLFDCSWNNGTYQYLFFHLSDGIIISRLYLKEKLQYL